MFSSTIIDVVIGLVFSFASVSLVSSAIQEAISSALKLRANDLLKGVQVMVNDPDFTGLAKQLYQHAAVNPLGVLTAKAFEINAVDLSRKPAYIAAQQFATAMTDILTLSDPIVRTEAPNVSLSTMKLAVDTALNRTNPQMSKMVHGMIDRSNGDLKQIEAALAAWFDNGMDRLSGAYKRRTQLVTFVVGLLLAVALNVDTIRIAHVLWNQPTLVDDLKLPPNVATKLCPQPASAVSAADTAKTKPTSDPEPVTGEHCSLKANAEEALRLLDDHLPVGWSYTAGAIPHEAEQWALTLSGWLITAIATLFGAPFWFDALQSFVRLKGTGPSPKETAANRAAAA